VLLLKRFHNIIFVTLNIARGRACLAEVSEELATDDEFKDEIEGDVVLEGGEEVYHKGMLQGADRVLQSRMLVITCCARAP
jgi:hypothetical protein